MKVISTAVIKQHAIAANGITKRPLGAGPDSAEISGYRRQLRSYIVGLAEQALTRPQGDPDRVAAVKSLGAIVVAMYVAEHDLRGNIQRAVEATRAA